MSSLYLSMLLYTLLPRVRGNILLNTMTIMDLNLILFPTQQPLLQDQLTNLEAILASFVESQLLSLYNVTTQYQLVDVGVSITNTFSLSTSYCRQLKISTPRSHVHNDHWSHRSTQKTSLGTKLTFSGYVVFQNSPVPDLESAQTDFINTFRELTLLLEYIKQQYPGIPELLNVTYIALSGPNILYQDINNDHCIFTYTWPQTDRVISKRNVVIGSTIGAIIVLIGVSSFLFLIRHRKRSRKRRDMTKQVFRLKHLSDDFDDESFVPSTSSDQRTCYASLCESGHAFENNNKRNSQSDMEKEEDDDMLSDPFVDLLDIGDDQEYFFKPLVFFNTTLLDDTSNMKTGTTDLSFKFDETSSSYIRAATPIPPIVDSDDNPLIESSECLPNSNINILDLNTHIGAFPSTSPIGSFLKSPYPYADIITLGSDSTSLNQSFTSGSTHIHPLDWSIKGSIHDGQSVDDTTMTETDMFIIHRQNTPLPFEKNEGGGGGEENGNERGDFTPADPGFVKRSIGSKEFVNDLVWLKQKLSKFEAISNVDDHLSNSSQSVSSDEEDISEIVKNILIDRTHEHSSIKDNLNH